MSNVIQIKHGSGNPSRKLKPYELGYSDDERALYIGIDTTSAQKLISLSDSQKLSMLSIDNEKLSIGDALITSCNISNSKFNKIIMTGNYGADDPNSIKDDLNPKDGQLYFRIIG